MAQRSLILLALSLAVLAAPVHASTVCVPGGAGTIQQALDAANGGDTVVVADGTWAGPGNRDLDFAGKAIELRSVNGPEACTIDAGGSAETPHRAFAFQSGEGGGSSVTGFTIAGGYAIGEGTAGSGGAILCVAASPTIAGNVFIGNHADGFAEHGGGAIACLGGAEPLIAGNDIIENSSPTGGGVFSYESSPVITGNRFADNAASYGGGLYCAYGDPAIHANRFTANRAVFAGGLYIAACSPMVLNNIVSGNRAVRNGGGAVIAYSQAGLWHNTIVANRAILYGGGLMCGYSQIECGAGIFWGNTAALGHQLAVASESELTVTDCDVEQAQAEAYVTGGSALLWESGNFDAGPLFTDPGHWDDTGSSTPDDDTWIDGDYHLQPGSPCIDAASTDVTDTDIEGNPRPLCWPSHGPGDPGRIYDAGACEAVPQRGDVNGDACVNVADLLMVRDALGRSGSDIIPPGSDANSDGIVNVADLLIVRDHLGLGCGL